MSTYPEHEKVAALNGQNDTIASFLEWLEGTGREIWRVHEHTEKCGRLVNAGIRIGQGADCQMYAGKIYPDGTARIEPLLAEYFGIDMKKLRDEKEAMYRELVAASR